MRFGGQGRRRQGRRGLPALALALALACGTGDDAPEPYVPPPTALPEATDFAFRIVDHHPDIGGRVQTVITGDGALEHLFFRARRVLGGAPEVTWHRAGFALSIRELTGLQDLLDEVDFWELPRRCEGEGEPGRVTHFALRAHGRTGEIACAGTHPEPLLRLRDYVRKELLDPHGRELAAAPAIPAPPR
ncbi:MAG: hypothetical protein AAF447_27270 [Myxococcota bacterium]